MIQHEPMSSGDYINLAINYLSTQNTRQIWMVMRNFHLILLNHLCISFDKYDIFHKLNRNSSCALVNVGYRPMPLNYQPTTQNINLNEMFCQNISKIINKPNAINLTCWIYMYAWPRIRIAHFLTHKTIVRLTKIRALELCDFHPMALVK